MLSRSLGSRRDTLCMLAKTRQVSEICGLDFERFREQCDVASSCDCIVNVAIIDVFL